MDSHLSIRFAGLDDINTIGFLAQQIWPSAYGEILSPSQLEYMLKLFYSPASLRQQMKDEQHRFLILEADDQPIGFASWSAAAGEQTAVYKLHKLYLLPDSQGKGKGKAMLQFILEDIRPRGAKALQLNVNRFNKARQFYEKAGFTIIREEDNAIGNDYWMNDYVMECPV